MAQLLVRNLEDHVKAWLRIRAAEHGHEVRTILRQAVETPNASTGGLGTEIAALFKDIGVRDDAAIPEIRGAAIEPWKFNLLIQLSRKRI